MGLQKPDAFNPYAAGQKVYGPEARTNPTSGPVDKLGYAKRDMMASARKRAMMGRLDAAMKGNYMSPDYLMGQASNG
jgi:hypothetical protein